MIRAKIAVKSYDPAFNDISWEIEGETSNVEFFLERCESPTGPFEVIAGPFKDIFAFRDVTANKLNRYRKFFYRLRWEGREQGTSSPSSAIPPQDLIAAEMTRRLYLRMREFTGRKVIVFPRRTSGSRCPDCWDPLRQKRVKEKCKTCYDVGFAGGFYHPFETLIELRPYPNQPQYSRFGVLADEMTMARALPFPPIKPGDIIAEAEMLRWRVGVVQPTEKLRSPVHLTLQLQLLPFSDIAYSLPAKIDDPSPIREFINPRDLELNFDVKRLYER